MELFRRYRLFFRNLSFQLSFHQSLFFFRFLCATRRVNVLLIFVPNVCDARQAIRVPMNFHEKVSGTKKFPHFQFQQGFHINFSYNGTNDVLAILIRRLKRLLRNSPTPFFLFDRYFLLMNTCLITLRFQVFQQKRLRIRSLTLFLFHLILFQQTRCRRRRSNTRRTRRQVSGVPHTSTLLFKDRQLIAQRPRPFPSFLGIRFRISKYLGR